jgi:hypothetical protein
MKRFYVKKEATSYQQDLKTLKELACHSEMKIMQQQG